MKKNLLTAVCGMLLVAFATAQAPQSLNYQAVARNAAGLPLINSSVAVRISIHDGSATGTVVYSERDAATTNGFGLFSCAIGTGNVISGTFAGIDWATGTKFMQVELDPTGGSSYTDMGTTQLLSVPYALHAKTANVADTVLHSGAPASVWTTTGNDIYSNNSGNVGIGTSTPASKLHVYSGGVLVEENPGQNSVELSQGAVITNDDAGGSSRFVTSIAGTWEWGAGKTYSSNSDYNIINYPASRWDFTILSANGNVGIGNLNPAAKLDVAGSVKITDGTEGNGKLLMSDANGLASWQNVTLGTTSYTGLSHNRFYISTSTGSPYTNINTGGSSVLIIGAGAPSNGFIDGFQHNGADELVIYNNNSTNWTIRPGQPTPSVPFYTGPTAPNYVIAPGKSVRIFYEPTTAKWWVLDGN